MLLSFLFLAQLSIAKKIETPYLSFQVPETYNCQTLESFYQCQDSLGPKMKDSILIAAFKKAGPQDSLEQYLSALNKPFTLLKPSSPPSLSQVIYVKKAKLNNWEWATAKHFESDLSNYYTYHWTTVREPVAMVIKYSVLKKNDEKRKNEIYFIMNSLTTKQVEFSPPTTQPLPMPSTDTTQPIKTTARSSAIKSDANTQKLLLGAIGAGLLILLFLLYKRKN